MVGKLYLLSTEYLPVDLMFGKVVIIQRLISIREARQILSGREFISAVDCEATAKLLTRLLKISVSCNRIQASLSPGDEAVCFVLRTRRRILEGWVLDENELRQLKFFFVYAKVLSSELVHELKY